jgi:predicted transcriptional regulator
MKEHKAISNVKSIQQEKESIKSITKGNQVAVSMDSIIIGRQVHEGDFLYSFIPENDFRKLKNLAKFLSKGEIELLKEIAEKMRKDNPMWGV